MKRITIIAFIFMMLDQMIKCVVTHFLDMGDSFCVINGFFNITFVGNTGAAFSILRSNTVFIIVLSLIALYLIYHFFIKNKFIGSLESVVFGLLYGGIMGNLIDRAFRGYVIDYLDFNIFGYSFPIFNCADICIVVSVVLLIAIMCKGEKNDI